MNDNIDSLKAFQNLMNNLGRPIGSRDIGLNEVALTFLFRCGARRDDNRCASLQEAIGNRLTRALRAPGHQDALTVEFADAGSGLG